MSDCKDGPVDMPKGPWQAVKLVLDSSMLFRIVSGESVVVEHRGLPADAEVMSVRQNGTDVVLIVGSQTYQAQRCLCTMPQLRVNYTTGG